MKRNKHVQERKPGSTAAQRKKMEEEEEEGVNQETRDVGCLYNINVSITF
jgi:hypothetical protein